MKKAFLLTLSIISLVVVLLVSACVATKTVTLEREITGTGGITRTISQFIGPTTQISIVVMAGEPPVVPHNIVGYSGVLPCFTCHPIPPGHEGRLLEFEVCTQCHKEGPVSLDIID